jgi:dephospho-CoA kinase
VEQGTDAFRAIVERWGTSILAADGMLDRGALRRIVFSDQAELEQLNAIVHPEVERMRAALVEQARQRGDRLVVCDIPLLFERRMTEMFERIVLVDAPRPVRLERLVRERGLRETEAMDMIVAQMPAELKRARADFVIDNDATLTQLDARVAEVWSALVTAAEATETADV